MFLSGWVDLIGILTIDISYSATNWIVVHSLPYWALKFQASSKLAFCHICHGLSWYVCSTHCIWRSLWWWITMLHRTRRTMCIALDELCPATGCTPGCGVSPFFSDPQEMVSVDGRNPANQLRLVVCPIIYRDFIRPSWSRISSINRFSWDLWEAKKMYTVYPWSLT